jgi:hypothetical protein
MYEYARSTAPISPVRKQKAGTGQMPCAIVAFRVQGHEGSLGMMEEGVVRR